MSGSAILSRGKSPSSGKMPCGPSMISVDYLETLAAPPADITLLEQLAAEHRDSGKYTEAQQHQDQADLLRKELEERRMQELIQRQDAETESVRQRQQDEFATFKEEFKTQMQLQNIAFESNLAAMVKRHEQEMTELKVSAEHESPVKPSTLATLANLRQVQQTLAQKKEWDKAEQTKQMADHLEATTRGEILARKQANVQQAMDKLNKRQAKEKEDLGARHEAANDQAKVQQTKEKEQMLKKHQVTLAALERSHASQRQALQSKLNITLHLKRQNSGPGTSSAQHSFLVANVFQKTSFKDYKEDPACAGMGKSRTMLRNTSSTGGNGTIAASRPKEGLVRSKSGNNISGQDTIRADSPTPGISRTNFGKLISAANVKSSQPSAPGSYSDDIKVEVAKTAITRTRSPSPQQGPPMLRTMERAARSARATSPQPAEAGWNSSTSTLNGLDATAWNTFGKADLARAQAGAHLPPKAKAPGKKQLNLETSSPSKLPHPGALLPDVTKVSFEVGSCNSEGHVEVSSPAEAAPWGMPGPDHASPSNECGATKTPAKTSSMCFVDGDETCKLGDSSCDMPHPSAQEEMLPTNQAGSGTVPEAENLGFECPVALEDASKQIKSDEVENDGEACGDSQYITTSACAKQCLELICYMKNPFLVEALHGNASGTMECQGPTAAENCSSMGGSRRVSIEGHALADESNISGEPTGKDGSCDGTVSSSMVAACNGGTCSIHGVDEAKYADSKDGDDDFPAAEDGIEDCGSEHGESGL